MVITHEGNHFIVKFGNKTYSAHLTKYDQLIMDDSFFKKYPLIYVEADNIISFRNSNFKRD